MKKTFFHGLHKCRWDKVKEQGYLIHDRPESPNASPVVYLAVSLEEASSYGDVLLKVQYDPFLNPDFNNYQEGAWQVRVYEPISLLDVEVVKSPFELGEPVDGWVDLKIPTRSNVG